MGQPYKIKHGLVVADEVIKVIGHDKKAYYNGNELTTEVRLSSEINTLSTEVNTRIDNLDATHTADITQIRLELDNLEMDTTAYVDGRVNILETQVNINTTNIGDLTQLINDSTDLVQAINQGSGSYLYMDAATLSAFNSSPTNRYVIPDEVIQLDIDGIEDFVYFELQDTRVKPLTVTMDNGVGMVLYANTWDEQKIILTDHVNAFGSPAPNGLKAITVYGNCSIEATYDAYNYSPGQKVFTLQSYIPVESGIMVPLKTVWGNNFRYPEDGFIFSNSNLPYILNKNEYDLVTMNYDGYYYQSSDSQAVGPAGGFHGDLFSPVTIFSNVHGYAQGTINLGSNPTNGYKQRFILLENFYINTGGFGTILLENGSDVGSNWSANQGEYLFIYDSSIGKWRCTYNSTTYMSTVGQGRFEVRNWLNINPTLGVNNTFLGKHDMSNVWTSTGNNNVGIGYDSLNNIGTGTHNTALGSVSGESVSSGSRNIFIGANTSINSSAGNDRVAIGYGATSNRDLICAITHFDAGKDYKLTLNASDYPTVSTLCFLNEKNNNSLTHGLLLKTDATYLITAMNRASRASMQVKNTGWVWAEQIMQGGEATQVEVGSGQTIILNQILGGSGELNTLRMVDTASNVVSYTLNYSSSELSFPGVYNTFVDMKGTFNSNPVTITINNQPFEGVAAPNTIVLDVDDTITKFVYTGASYGWKRITMLNQ